MTLVADLFVRDGNESEKTMPALSVQQIMQNAPLAVEPDTPLLRVEKILVLCQLHEVYVTNGEGLLLGVVPDHEFLKARLLGNYEFRTVGETMVPVHFYVRPNDSVRQVACFLREHIHQRLAVVEERKLVGVVTRQSVLRALIDNSIQAECSPSESSSVPVPKFMAGARPTQHPHRQILQKSAHES